MIDENIIKTVNKLVALRVRDATDFLKVCLSDGAVTFDAVREAGGENGFSVMIICLAADHLGAISDPESMTWKLPEDWERYRTAVDDYREFELDREPENGSNVKIN